MFTLLIISLLIAIIGASKDPLVKWRQMPAWANHITANDKGIYATNRLWQLFYCPRPCNGKWQYKGWFAGNVAANQWEVWVVAVDGRIFRSRTPAKTTAFWWEQNGWSIANGILRSVSLGTKMVAGVNRDNNAFMSHFDFAGGSQRQPSWTLLPGKWRQVSVSADNKLWGVSSAGQVLKYNKNQQKWRPIPNPTSINFNAISVGRKYIYATASDLRIYRCFRPCKLGGWQQTDGLLREVSAENTADQDIAYGVNHYENTFEGKVSPIN